MNVCCIQHILKPTPRIIRCYSQIQFHERWFFPSLFLFHRFYLNCLSTRFSWYIQWFVVFGTIVSAIPKCGNSTEMPCNYADKLKLNWAKIENWLIIFDWNFQCELVVSTKVIDIIFSTVRHILSTWLQFAIKQIARFRNTKFGSQSHGLWWCLTKNRILFIKSLEKANKWEFIFVHSMAHVDLINRRYTKLCDLVA